MTIAQRLSKVFTGSQIAYYPGCFVEAQTPQLISATKQVLRDLGIVFITPDSPCCGWCAHAAGSTQDGAWAKRRLRAQLEEQRIGSIITNDPHCALVLREQYQVETHHILEVLNAHLEKIAAKHQGIVAYHHACFLDKLGIDERIAVRILRRAGIHATPSRGCCGSVGQDFTRNEPVLARAIGKQRALALREQLIITACPHCLVALRGHGAQVKDIIELLSEG